MSGWPTGSGGAQGIQRRSLEVVGSNHTAAQSLGYSQTCLGAEQPLPGYVEIWVCEQGITLKLAWRPSNFSQKNPAGFFNFISASLYFSNLLFFSFRNSLMVVLFSVFGTFAELFIPPKKENKHFAVLWLKISYLARDA